jgi:hypothetical protein
MATSFMEVKWKGKEEDLVMSKKKRFYRSIV